MKDQIFKINGAVQHYAWGGFDFIPSLLRMARKEQKPYAEYWLGAHPSAPSDVELPDGTSIFLNAAIKQLPFKYIGEKVYERFGELPYLLKVLDVREMLSIQVHPTREEAIKGFEKEEAAGIPIDAPHRNYKDRNHKPEVMIALSDFWLLHGFKPADELVATLQQVPSFKELVAVFEKEGYFGLYKHVMEMPQDAADAMLGPVVKEALAGTPPKNDPAYWVAKLYNGNAPVDGFDRGIFSIYFFNIVQLHKGQAIFQQAGVPHAYLEGQNVELMANSDNVLRGGLTPKHVDVPELLKQTTFEPIHPYVQGGVVKEGGERIFDCPVEDFGISMFSLENGKAYTATAFSAEIFLITQGSVSVGEQQFSAGEAFLVAAETEYTIVANEDTEAYKAFVPKLA
ncbi:mannose-6-phosphate isomerase, class I [Aridibaculum aurantiacum]|uniref:mannose-6-phosphate isomerase, class I n=1 Tax=Aridibaculum aurantiacum TaxID=2810307 RepID=UPI001A970480|nr:mannose-6-phosphate isomerase, class I [Aridibaculum aurantiacum]